MSVSKKKRASQLLDITVSTKENIIFLLSSFMYSELVASLSSPRGTAVLKLTTVIILRGEIHVILISRDYGA